jgi:hypothetical protein
VPTSQVVVHVLGGIGIHVNISIRGVVIEWLAGVQASVERWLRHRLIPLRLEVVL